MFHFCLKLTLFIHATPFKEAHSYQQSYSCETIVRSTLSTVNHLLFCLDEHSLVCCVFLLQMGKSVDGRARNLCYTGGGALFSNILVHW